MREIRYLVIHHTADGLQNLGNAISVYNRVHKQSLHKNRNSFGLHIAYHYVIAPDGSYRQTRGLHEVGHHCGNWRINQNSIGIVLMGNFEISKPTPQQYITLVSIIKMLKILEYSFSFKIIGHKEVRATACPGRLFSFQTLNYLLNKPNMTIEKRNYKDIMRREVDNLIFNDHSGENALSEEDVKSLIEIGIHRALSEDRKQLNKLIELLVKKTDLNSKYYE